MVLIVFDAISDLDMAVSENGKKAGGTESLS